MNNKVLLVQHELISAEKLLNEIQLLSGPPDLVLVRKALSHMRHGTAILQEVDNKCLKVENES